MLVLLVILVMVAVAFVHRVIQVIAPSNLLVRSVRSARPSGRLAAALVCLAAVLLLAMHVVANAVAAGAPGWLHVLVLVLAWDAIKVGWLAVSLMLRRAAGAAPQIPGPRVRPPRGRDTRTLGPIAPRPCRCMSSVRDDQANRRWRAGGCLV